MTAELAFEQSYPASSRIAAVQATRIVVRNSLPDDFIEDLAQEGLLALWRSIPEFDERRAGWRTFSEHVVANRLASLLRSMYSSRSGHGKEDPLDDIQLSDPAPYAGIDLQRDVRRILDGVSPFDRRVALSLINYSASETGRRLRVARATVYRSIDRLKVAFVDAGFDGSGGSSKRCPANLEGGRS